MDFLSKLFGGASSALGSIGQGVMNMFSGGGSPMNIGGGKSTYGSNNIPMGMGNSKMPNMGGGGMMNNFMSNPIAQGAGIMGLGQMIGGKTKVPSFNTPAVQNLQSFSQNPPQLPQSMQDEINKSSGIQEEQQLRNLRDTYKNARPGTDYTTDSAYQRDLANLQRDQTSNRANAVIKPTMDYLAPQQKNLEELAQLSVAEIMHTTGMKAMEAQQLKEMFSNVGGAFINKGLFPDAYTLPVDMFRGK